MPAGFVKTHKGQPGSQFKVKGDLTGDAFITNLENINKQRVQQDKAMAQGAGGPEPAKRSETLSKET